MKLRNGERKERTNVEMNRAIDEGWYVVYL
jgi:hypothetical protein